MARLSLLILSCAGVCTAGAVAAYWWNEPASSGGAVVESGVASRADGATNDDWWGARAGDPAARAGRSGPFRVASREITSVLEEAVSDSAQPRYPESGKRGQVEREREAGDVQGPSRRSSGIIGANIEAPPGINPAGGTVPGPRAQTTKETAKRPSPGARLASAETAQESKADHAPPPSNEPASSSANVPGSGAVPREAGAHAYHVWPRGNFTPEQELQRAQFGWQAFADDVFEQALGGQ
jgi:hypothetical protein